MISRVGRAVRATGRGKASIINVLFKERQIKPAPELRQKPFEMGRVRTAYLLRVFRRFSALDKGTRCVPYSLFKERQIKTASAFATASEQARTERAAKEVKP